MTALTRRNLLGSAALAAAATALPQGARAAAPAAGKQAPAFYRYKIGSYELTAIHDGVWMRKVDNNFIRGASRPEIEKAMANAFMAKDIVPTPFTPLAVNTGSKLVLIDTGTGGQMQAPAGGYMANLAAAGIDPKGVDAILISHFHPDHINGIRDKDGGLVFPNAEIQVPAPEWAYWMDDANMGKAPEAARPVWLNVRRVFKDIGDKVVKFEPGKELVPASPRCTRPGTRPVTRHSSWRQATSRCWCSATSPTIHICFCAIRTGRVPSTPMVQRRSRRVRKCSRNSPSTACWCRAITSPSRLPATWSRPARIPMISRRCCGSPRCRAGNDGAPRRGFVTTVHVLPSALIDGG